MSELSIHELEAQTGEVLPEREALSVFVVGSFNRHIDSHNTTNNTTTTTHLTTVTAANSSNSSVSHAFLSSSSSSASQTVSVNG